MARWIVGMDGSEDAQHSLRWAVSQARGRDVSITAVTAWNMPVVPTGLGAVVMPNTHDLGASYQQQVEGQVAAVDAGEVDVNAVAVQGTPSGVLLDAAQHAALLVVGGRGLGRFRGAMLGSVSQRCVHHAETPVAVIPAGVPTEPVRRILVGFDGSTHAVSALRWALDFAGDSAGVTALSAFDLAPWLSEELVRDRYPAEVEAAEQEFRAALAAADTTGRATPQFAVADPRFALARASADADLVVLGARGASGFTAALVGSVTTWMLHAATHPTMVVHERAQA